jgi:hypothetical protein
MKPVPLTPAQQKLAADYLKFASITAKKFKHLAPYDELFSACQVRLVLCARNYDPDNVAGANFKTYLIRSLRWACSKVITERRDRVQACQLSIDIPAEDHSPVDAVDLHDMIDMYAVGTRQREVVRASLQVRRPSQAAPILGVTKQFIFQERGNFIARARSMMLMEVA